VIRKACCYRLDSIGRSEQAILDAVEAKLAEITLSDSDGEPATLANAAVQAMTRIDEIQRRGKSAGVPTGLSSFDNDMGACFQANLRSLRQGRVAEKRHSDCKLQTIMPNAAGWSTLHRLKCRRRAFHSVGVR